jgi:hypothetical protein
VGTHFPDITILNHFYLFIKFCLSMSALKSQQYIQIFLFLVQANAILLPLEAMLSKDVAAMTDAMARERETSTEISPIHGQAIYQSYCLRIREACQTFKPMVPSLTFSVKGLYSMLTRLARTASLHAGNLHKVFIKF